MPELDRDPETRGQEREEALERERKVQAALSVAEAGLGLALEAAQLRVWHVGVLSGRATYAHGAGAQPGVFRLTACRKC